MGRRKKVTGPISKVGRGGEEKFANLNLSLQPIVLLSKLNTPKSFKESNQNYFTINVKSKSFKNLFIDMNNHQSRIKTRHNSVNKNTVNTLKPITELNKNQNQSSEKSKSNSFLTNEIDEEMSSVSAIENDNEMLSEEDLEEFVTPNNGSEDQNPAGDKENQCFDTRSLTEEEFTPDPDITTNNEDNSTEGITRIDKVIDTFLSVMRKTTDDNTILSALQRDYICDLCKQGFIQKNTLRKHMMICGLKKKPKKKIKKVQKHVCPMCGITYVNKYSLDKHNANVHNLKKMYKCLVCSQHFYNEDGLTLHCRSRHGLGGSDIYKCAYCEATFNLRGDLKLHCGKAHNTTKLYVCSKCLDCFKSEDTLKLHEESHGLCCEICTFKTKNESEMNAHTMMHFHMVIYKCERCARTFKAKSYFTKHIKVHEREKRFREGMS